MKILFIGDIVGRPGRNAVQEILPKLKKENKYDCVIANGENLTHGKGASEKDINAMREMGIDFFTSGNHIWRHKTLMGRIGDPKFHVIRPANYPDQNPGKGYQVIETGLKKKILIINLMGRVFFPSHTDCPFKKADQILRETAYEKPEAIVIDFHAEATSEKVAFGHYLDGRVSAVIGTHTHIPTSDYRILPQGTAYISDAGMAGKKNSVIGVDKEPIIEHFLTQLPVAHEITPDGIAIFCAVEIEIDTDTRKAISIKQILKETNASSL